MSESNGQASEEDIVPPQLDDNQARALNAIQLQLASIQLDATTLVIRGNELMEFGRTLNEKAKQLLAIFGLEPSIHLLDKLISLDGEDK